MDFVFVWLSHIDWSTFLPDLIVGMITGAVVGLMLYLWASRTERRRKEDEVLRDWVTLKSKLNAGLRRPWSPSVDSFANLGAAKEYLYAQISNAPVVAWYEVLPAPGMEEAVTFQYFFEAASGTGTTVESNLSSCLARAGVFGDDADLVAKIIRFERLHSWSRDDAYTAREVNTSISEVQRLAPITKVVSDDFKKSIYLGEYESSAESLTQAGSRLLDSLLNAEPGPKAWLHEFRKSRRKRLANAAKLPDRPTYNPR